MASKFDPIALADKIIAERQLEPVFITGAGGALRFSPGWGGDGEHIQDTVKALGNDARKVLDDMAATIDETRMDAAYTALHVPPRRRQASPLYKPSAVLGLLIAERLGVNVPA